MNYIKLMWNSAEGAEGYKITIKNDRDEVIIEEDLGNVLEYIFENVQRSAIYSWKIIPYNLAGDALNTEFWNFTTEEDSITLPEATTPVYPEDGEVDVIVDEIISETLLPATNPNPAIGSDLPAGGYLPWNFYWKIDALSSPTLGCYWSLKENGILIVDREDRPNTLSIPNHAAYVLEPNSSYEWKVIPYDAESEAENCPWWNLTTTSQTQTKTPRAFIGGAVSTQPTFSVPLTVTTFKHITAFNFTILYNSTGDNVGICTGAIPNPKLGGQFNVEFDTVQHGPTVLISWVGNSAVGLEDNEELLTLNFDHNPNMNAKGFSQVEFYKQMADPSEGYNAFWNDDLLLPKDYFKNGYINTHRDETDPPLPVLYKTGTDNVVPHPNQLGLRIDGTGLMLDWSSGNAGHGSEAYHITIKKGDEVITDNVYTGVETWTGSDGLQHSRPKSKFTFPEPLEYETIYTWNVMPSNQYGDAYMSEEWTFKTETEFKLDSPIYTVGSFETSDNAFNVPVTAKDFTDVSLGDMIINYDETVIKCESVNILIPYSMGMAGPNGDGRISIAWLLSLDTNTVPDDTPIFNLNFTKITEGETEISIVTGVGNTLTGYVDEEGVMEMFNDEPYEDFYLIGLVKTTTSNATIPPDCVDTLLPVDGATEVGTILEDKVKVLFEWQASPIATGYKIFNETANEIIDIGNKTSHILSLVLNTEYTWSVIPYNEFGDATDCPSHTFKTIEDTLFNLETTIQTPVVNGNSYDLDVTVKDLLSVGAISLTMNYDEEVVQYDGITLNDGFNGMVNDLGGQFRIGWFASTEAQTLSLPPDAVLFTMHFTLLPTIKTQTTFEWSKVSGECEYAGYGGTPIYDATFNDLTWIFTSPKRS